MTPLTNRRRFLASMSALGLTGFGAASARAQSDYPGKGPIKVVIPLPAGGAADASARILTTALQEQMKQSFVVDNRPGGNFVIGMQAMAQAPADGYTLMHINPGMLSAQASLKRFDLLKTLAPISLMGTMPAVLSVPASSPFKTVKDLVASGSAKTGSLNYGSVGLGSLEHLWSSNFSKRHHLEAVHVPFKGMPDATTALVAGDIQFLPLVLSVALPFAQKGMLRPLAVIDTQRSPSLPNVPTLKELGFDEPSLIFWGGFAAPKATPPAVMERVRESMASALSSPDVKGKFAAIGSTAVSSPSSQSFEALIARDLAWITEAVKGANLQLN